MRAGASCVAAAEGPMDIVTHVMMGAAATSPFWATHPLESVTLVFGSMLPDVDAFSRSFGKVAYLRSHQTWTHAIPMQVALTAIGVALLHASDLALFVPAVLCLGAGAVLHSLLDWTNTYGVTLFAPFDRERRCLEWVFFIDGTVVGLTVGALVAQGWLFATAGTTSVAVGVGWLLATAAYFLTKAALRRRAGEALPAAVSLVPSALWPWRFYALVVDGERATTCTVNGWTGALTESEEHRLGSPNGLEALAEYRVMRELSAGFLPLAATGGRLVCRDLRTRNFGTDFGRLTVDLRGPEPRVEQFDV